ncbi:uncharacterized protein LOC108151137 [Drosophila miranda]|uniref:uncharacterized protein LOC108151137 n=1 Tax=Drosophila miranda TaxID=7229 RepID=UPI0007E7FB72|nr:uncharacterized protein LOC108151137 [Drosophila miranda]
MMSMNINNRLMLLECLRENATNRRIEDQALLDRITAALQKSRDSLRKIQDMNNQLKAINISVKNALASIRDPAPADVAYVVKDMYNILVDNVAASLSNSVFASVAQRLESETIIPLDSAPAPEEVPHPDSDPQPVAEPSASSEFSSE